MRTRRRILADESGQMMPEACIGLALMAFVWVVSAYSLFMANNSIRAEMAARYAAWYQGASGGSAAPASQVDQYFFYQTGLSTVSNGSPQGVSFLPSGASNLFTPSDGSGGNGPFKASVRFGISGGGSSNAFPFVLLNTHVPLMPDSTMSNAMSVQSSCQWDGTGDNWGGSWKTVLAVLFNEITSAISL
jgi:hypothetical protein